MELLAAAITACALAAAAWCASIVLPLRARLEKLELERPAFIAELERMVGACDDLLERAALKQKRADNALRAAQGDAAQTTNNPAPVVPLRARSLLERLPGQ